MAGKGLTDAEAGGDIDACTRMVELVVRATARHSTDAVLACAGETAVRLGMTTAAGGATRVACSGHLDRAT